MADPYPTPFRSELAAAHVRIAQLESAQAASRASPRLRELQEQRARILQWRAPQRLILRIIVPLTLLLMGAIPALFSGVFWLSLLFVPPAVLFGYLLPRAAERLSRQAVSSIDAEIVAESAEARRLERLEEEVVELRAAKRARVEVSTQVLREKKRSPWSCRPRKPSAKPPSRGTGRAFPAASLVRLIGRGA